MSFFWGVSCQKNDWTSVEIRGFRTWTWTGKFIENRREKPSTETVKSTRTSPCKNTDLNKTYWLRKSDLIQNRKKPYYAFMAFFSSLHWSWQISCSAGVSSSTTWAQALPSHPPAAARTRSDRPRRWGAPAPRRRPARGRSLGRSMAVEPPRSRKSRQGARCISPDGRILEKKREIVGIHWKCWIGMWRLTGDMS